MNFQSVVSMGSFNVKSQCGVSMWSLNVESQCGVSMCGSLEQLTTNQHPLQHSLFVGEASMV